MEETTTQITVFHHVKQQIDDKYWLNSPKELINSVYLELIKGNLSNILDTNFNVEGYQIVAEIPIQQKLVSFGMESMSAY